MVTIALGIVILLVSMFCGYLFAKFLPPEMLKRRWGWIAFPMFVVLMMANNIYLFCIIATILSFYLWAIFVYNERHNSLSPLFGNLWFSALTLGVAPLIYVNWIRLCVYARLLNSGNDYLFQVILWLKVIGVTLVLDVLFFAYKIRFGNPFTKR